jgi:hypothetical protein
MRDDHAELRRNDVEPLRRLLADRMHRRAAAGAVGILWRNRHVDMRQMGRKCAAIGASLISALACTRKVLLVLGRLVAGDGLLDVLNRQLQLLGIELLRAAAELRALQLAQEMLQAFHPRQRLVALSNRGVALGARRHDQRLQRLGVGRKMICHVAHVRTQSDSPRVVACGERPDSIGRRAHDVAVGRATSRAGRGSVTTGTKSGASSAGRLSTPARAALRQTNRCCDEIPCRRATSETTAPGA